MTNARLLGNDLSHFFQLLQIINFLKFCEKIRKIHNCFSPYFLSFALLFLSLHSRALLLMHVVLLVLDIQLIIKLI